MIKDKQTVKDSMVKVEKLEFNTVENVHALVTASVTILQNDKKLIEALKCAIVNDNSMITLIKSTNDMEKIVTRLQERLLISNVLPGETNVYLKLSPEIIVITADIIEQITHSPIESKRFIELYDKIGRLGRCTNFHIVLANKYRYKLPEYITTNIGMRLNTMLK